MPGGQAVLRLPRRQGAGPLRRAPSPAEEYAETRRARCAISSKGGAAGVDRDLEREMREAAADLDFERAARCRNRLEAVRSILERQTVVSERRLDADVIGVHREETIAVAHLFQVREGRVLAGTEFVLDQGLDVTDADLVEGFLLRYYAQATHVPKEVLVAVLPRRDPRRSRSGCPVCAAPRSASPCRERGEKRALLELATTNARHALARYTFRTRYDEERTNAALLQLESALALPAPPMRIECFDISTLHGRFSVGSMVVFEGGRPSPGGLSPLPGPAATRRKATTSR